MSAQTVRIFTPQAQGSTPLVSSEPTVSQVLDWFDQVEGLGVTSSAMERRRVRGLLRAEYGGHLVSQCRPFDLLNFINQQSGVVSDWTRKRWNSTCQRPFNYAEKMGVVIKNPFRGLTFSEGPEGRDWTRDECQAVFRNSDPCFRRYLIGIRFSGMRPGEVRGLSWTDIKIESDCIRIEKHKTRNKTKEPRRIPFNAVLLKLLHWCKKNNPTNSRHVFLNSFGKPWSCKAVTKRLAKLRKKLSLPDDQKLHGLRHTFATGAIINGVGLLELMELLGHKSVVTTQRYTHLVDKVDHLTGAMSRAVQSKPKARPEVKKQEPPTPLFDSLR